MSIFVRVIAAMLAMSLTLLIFFTLFGLLGVEQLPPFLTLGMAIRLFITRAFWEIVAKTIELSVSAHEVGRRVPLLRRAWAARHWLRWRLLRQMALHGGIAFTTILMTLVSTVAVSGSDHLV